jgi:steroid delta-isomerase
MDYAPARLAPHRGERSARERTLTDVANVPADILGADEIAQVVSSYMRSIERGNADEVATLFADNAIFHNPVGGDVYRGREEIRAAYRAWLDGYKPGVDLVSLNAAGGEAAVHFQVSQDGQRIDVIDVITFDQEAKMTSLRAYYGPPNVVAQ